jgi:hypothetical protein
MNLSIERLRLLIDRKASTYAALTASWQSVLDSRNGVNNARRDVDHANESRAYVADANARKKEADRRADPVAPAQKALSAAIERLERAEALHERCHGEWEAAAAIAKRGYEFASAHIIIPIDIREAFN